MNTHGIEELKPFRICTSKINDFKPLEMNTYPKKVEGSGHFTAQVVPTYLSNVSSTISGFVPTRNGGPQVPAPQFVKTSIRPRR